MGKDKRVAGEQSGGGLIVLNSLNVLNFKRFAANRAMVLRWW
jgi:hypothetical protein